MSKSAILDRDTADSLLETYRGLIKLIAVPNLLAPLSPRRKPTNVVLTDSTGTLGTVILRKLLARQDIGHISCLNRAPDGGRAVQISSFAAAGLPTDGIDSRVTFLRADTSHPFLGLDDAMYQTLRSRTTLIIHNAWPVDFNLTLSEIGNQLVGLVHLFALAADVAIATNGLNRARLAFVSSIAATAGHSRYAQSKSLAELLCDTASAHLGSAAVPVTIIRLGQVIDNMDADRESARDRSEWLPSLLMSSLYLGCLPDSLGSLSDVADWVPLDAAGEAVVDLSMVGPGALGWATGKGDTQATTPNRRAEAKLFHVRSPETTTWDALVPAIQHVAQLRRGEALEMVKPGTWLARLEQSCTRSPNGAGRVDDGDGSDVAMSTAARLVDFYRESFWVRDEFATSLGPMAVAHAEVASPALDAVPPVKEEWIQKWVCEWMKTM